MACVDCSREVDQYAEARIVARFRVSPAGAELEHAHREHVAVRHEIAALVARGDLVDLDTIDAPGQGTAPVQTRRIRRARASRRRGRARRRLPEH